MLLPRRPATPSASGECPREQLIVSGHQPYETQTKQKNQKLETLGRRSFLYSHTPGPGYTFRLTQAFVSAVDAAEADANADQRRALGNAAVGPAPQARANVAPAPHAGAGVGCVRRFITCDLLYTRITSAPE